MSDTDNIYENLKIIASGGFGTVYLVRKCNKYYALKKITGRGIARELSGMKRYGDLSKSAPFSENVVEISEISISENTLSYLMPLCDCFDEKYADNPLSPSWAPKTLYNLICKKDEGKSWFTGDEIKTFLRPIFNATVSLSEHGILHRDIKPDNILFFDGKAKLGDFGLATQDRKSISAMGTPDYLAPTWYLNSNGDADMWGLAATLYTVMTGFSPDTLGKVAYRFPKQNSYILSEEDKKLWNHWHRCIDRATHEKPSERFRNIADFRDAVFSENIDVLLPNESKTETSNNKKYLLVFAVICIALGVFVFRHLNSSEVESSVKNETITSTILESQIKNETSTTNEYTVDVLPNGAKILTNKQGIKTEIPQSTPFDNIFPKFFKNKICKNKNEYIATMILNGKNAESDMKKIFDNGVNPKDWGMKYFNYQIKSYSEHCQYWDNEIKKYAQTNEKLTKQNNRLKCTINNIDAIEYCTAQKNQEVYMNNLKSIYCDFICILLYDKCVQRVFKSDVLPDAKTCNSAIKDKILKDFNSYKNDLKQNYLKAKKEWENINNSDTVALAKNNKSSYWNDYHKSEKTKNYLRAKAKFENPEREFIREYALIFKYEFLIYEVSKYTNNNN